MELDDVAGALYSLAPEEFTAARDQRAVEARRAGERDVAASIKRLRRPTASAWLANLLVRRHPAQIRALLDLGSSMRQAQVDLAGDELRRLSQQRLRMVIALVDAARKLAGDLGRPVTDANARELGATLEAAVADVDAADALGSGRLTGALRYSGLGPADTRLAESPRPVATSGDGSRPQTRRDPRARRSPASRGSRDVDSAERAGRGGALASADAERGAAEVALDDAERRAGELDMQVRVLREERARRRQEVVDLERRTRRARTAAERAGRELLAADKERGAADRVTRAARERVTRAQRAVDQLGTADDEG